VEERRAELENRKRKLEPEAGTEIESRMKSLGGKQEILN